MNYHWKVDDCLDNNFFLWHSKLLCSLTAMGNFGPWKENPSGFKNVCSHIHGTSEIELLVYF